MELLVRRIELLLEALTDVKLPVPRPKTRRCLREKGWWGITHTLYGGDIDLRKEGTTGTMGMIGLVGYPSR